MGMEDKKDNKVDTSRNGRPINLNLGGEDFFIDLPNAIPGEESAEDLDRKQASELLGELETNYKEIEDLLKSVGIDDINNLNLEDGEE